MRLETCIGVMKLDPAVPIQRYAVRGSGEILGGEPEVDRMTRDQLSRETRDEPRGASLEHLPVRLPKHLDMTHRELEVIALPSSSR